jgi:hypothetical protein
MGPYCAWPRLASAAQCLALAWSALFVCMATADSGQGRVTWVYTYVASRTLGHAGHQYALGVAADAYRFSHQFSRPIAVAIGVWLLYAAAVLSLGCGLAWADRRSPRPIWWRIALVCALWVYSPIPIGVVVDPAAPPMAAALWVATWALVCHGLLLVAAPRKGEPPSEDRH